MKQEKEIKGSELERDKVKLPLFAHYTIPYIESPEETHTHTHTYWNQ